MKKGFEISVIMSVYKEPVKWIKQSIDSILNQTFRDFEFIIINDNPNGIEQKEILEKYAVKDNRIHIINNKVNIGLTKSLNIALNISKGKYIARMDADDISQLERLQKQYEFMEENPDVGVVGCNIKIFGKRIDEWKYPVTHEDAFIFFASPFAHPAVLIRAEVLHSNKIKYNENLKYAQDFDLWERLYSKTHFANIQEFLLYYRTSNIQVTSQKQVEQYAISTSIKLRAFNTYCSYNQIDFKIDSPITLTTIKKYKKQIPLFKFNAYAFLPFIYRSLSQEHLNALFYFLYKRDFLHIPLFSSLKIVCYLIGIFKRPPMLSFDYPSV